MPRKDRRPTVALVGTLDSKGEEYAFLRDRVLDEGCAVLMVNAGPLGDPDYPVDVTRHDVAAAAGADLDALLAAGDRGAAVTAMAEGAAAVASRLHAGGAFDAILGAGGSGGTSIVAAAMRALPVGVPKVLVSTMAAGDSRSFTGISDIAMMYSVVDIAGINQISARLLGNAAAGVAGMARVAAGRTDAAPERPMVGATMWGATTPCVDRARRRLDDAGYEVLVFHATGTGGRSMEALVRSGFISGVLDVTTAELANHECGGAMDAGPDRLEVAGALGVPQVVAPGALNIMAFTPPETVPRGWEHRVSYRHNPHVTLVRLDVEESQRVGAALARKLNAARGPVALFVPLRGFSLYSTEGAVFWDPVADRALLDAVRAGLDPAVEVVEMDTDIADPRFADAMASRLQEMLEAARREPLTG